MTKRCSGWRDAGHSDYFGKSNRNKRGKMYQSQRLHKGKMADCKVCTPIQKPKRRERNFEPKVARKVRGLEGNIRRQMAEEVGEDELSKDFRFGLLQKYGLIAARIDRKVTKPIWMEESTWILKKKQFHDATKGMFPSFRPNPRPASPPRKFDKSHRTFHPRGSAS